MPSLHLQPSELRLTDDGILCRFARGRERLIPWHEMRLLEVAVGSGNSAEGVPDHGQAELTLYANSADIRWQELTDARGALSTRGEIWLGLLRRLGLAVAGGLVLAGPSLLFFFVTSRTGGLGYSPIQNLSTAALLVRLLVEIPLLTALVEEVVFRQYLYVKFAASTPARTIARNAGIFTLWHLVVTLRTVSDTTLARQPLLLIGAYLGSLGTTFVGGVVFAYLRQRTGSFAYSAVTHWLIVALLTLGAWVF